MINIKNNDTRVHCIHDKIISPLKVESIPKKYLNNPTIKALIDAGKLKEVSDEDKVVINNEADEAVQKRLSEELDALRQEAKDLGISNTHNMKRETLEEKIAAIKAAGQGVPSAADQT